ncbi:MAG: T9SS type A sorting domain-containing protein [Bacteroidales bacterium]|nr:T9SS type A sorting domain-containing protein [Bacteroidales bacterium]
MKQFFTLFILLFGFTLTHAQLIPRDKIIVEGTVGFWTTYCAGATLGADELIENDYDVAVILNHFQDSLANVYSNARVAFYQTTVYPTMYIDGLTSIPGGSSTNSLFPEYEEKVIQRMSIPSAYDIDIDLQKNGLNYSAEITIDNVVAAAEENLVFYFVITESRLPVSWGLADEQNHINRLMVPDQNGTIVDFEGGLQQTINLNFSVEPFWETDYCEIVAFIQDTASEGFTPREVKQGTKMVLAIPDHDIDAEARWILYPDTVYCGDTLEPVVYIRNKGAETLNSLDITYTVNDDTILYYDWTGDLDFTEGEEVYLPKIGFEQLDINEFRYKLSNPNGVTDQNPDNDSLQLIFHKAPQYDSAEIYVKIKTDDFPEETFYRIYNDEGEIVFSNSNFDPYPNTILIDTVTLHGTGCYTFVIYDTFGDGMCCEYGEGYYEVWNKDYSVYITGSEFEFEEARPIERIGENILICDFLVDDTFTIQGDSVFFTDESLGTVSEWQWNFYGGQAVDSTVENPIVFYSDTGYYDVTLIISDGITSDTLTKEDYIFVDFGVGQKDLREDRVVLYPNPTTGKLFVSGVKNARIEVYSIMGRKVYADARMENNFIDLSGLKAGIYFVKIGLDDQTVISKKISLFR